MKRRLFLYTTSIVFAGLIVFFTLTVYITSGNNLKTAKDMVIEITQICSDFYSYNTDISDFSFLSTETYTRITIISADGTVLADSRPLDLGQVQNHLNRPEIQAALSGSPETFVRYSDTIGINFIYYAVKISPNPDSDDYIFIRAAIPVEKIDTYLFQSLPLLIVLLLVVALASFFIIRNITTKILKPFNSIEEKLKLLVIGQYVPNLDSSSYEEIDKITHKIDDVALVLQKSIIELNDERNKLNYIVNNISDGLFAIDKNREIALINNTALDILDITQLPKPINEAIDGCINSKKISFFETTLNGKFYLTTVKRLPNTTLTMVILSDVTENRKNAKLREEFFANASHELKTPLTSIKVFNELNALNNKEEGLNKYISGITRETDRMLLLIGDMLKLSELENMSNVNPTDVSLARVANETIEALSPSINEKAISLNLIGDTIVKAEQNHVYELVKNLLENAVRYNNQDGRVTVIIENGRMSVSDTGIGISPEEQTRIFERFYRVEKSRSVKSGGTGLGLSIVKHICELYGWKLSLKSKYGVGTDIIVSFSC